MDKEAARFLLRAYRPDGEDARDPSFAEALRLAAEDRELGEWLSQERAMDAKFAAAVSRVELPECLRDGILKQLALSQAGEVEVDAWDQEMMRALADVEPPAGLRTAILEAGRVTDGKWRWPWKRLAVPLAAAAGIAAAFLLKHEPPQVPTAAVPVTAKAVPMEQIPAGFIRTYHQKAFALEERDRNPQVLIRHLRERGLPCPDCGPCGHIPAGLKKFPSLGCSELVIDGKTGSVICFDLGEDGIVHLIVFRREDVENPCGVGDDPCFMSCGGGWSRAAWSTHDEVFVLVGKLEKNRLAAMF